MLCETVLAITGNLKENINSPNFLRGVSGVRQCNMNIKCQDQGISSQLVQHQYPRR